MAALTRPCDPPNLNPALSKQVHPSDLARALRASWDSQTAYQGAVVPGNPAFGQCYPTSRVVVHRASGLAQTLMSLAGVALLIAVVAGATLLS